MTTVGIIGLGAIPPLAAFCRFLQIMPFNNHVYRIFSNRSPRAKEMVWGASIFHPEAPNLEISPVACIFILWDVNTMAVPVLAFWCSVCFEAEKMSDFSLPFFTMLMSKFGASG